MEIPYASFILAVSVGMFKPWLGILVFLAASQVVEWRWYWIYVLTSFALLVVVHFIERSRG